MNVNGDALCAAHYDKSVVPNLKALSLCSAPLTTTDFLFLIDLYLSLAIHEMETVKLTTALQLLSLDCKKMTAFRPSVHQCRAVLQRARLAAPRVPRHASHSLAVSASCRASRGATSQGVASRNLGIRPTSETAALQYR